MKPYHVVKICLHCGSRAHTMSTCDADKRDILLYRIAGLAKDWENTAFHSADPLIKAKEAGMRQCGKQLLSFLDEYNSAMKDKSIVDAFKESRGSNNTSSLPGLFPSLFTHSRERTNG